jgi:hypothetical protein
MLLVTIWSTSILKLAMQVEPNRIWHIVTSDEHSTVWDGKKTLSDMNFLALGVTAIMPTNNTTAP